MLQRGAPELGRSNAALVTALADEVDLHGADLARELAAPLTTLARVGE